MRIRRCHGLAAVLSIVVLGIAAGTTTATHGFAADAGPAYKGLAGPACEDLSRFHVSWYYNWSIDPGGCDGATFVPTIPNKPAITAGDVTWNVDRVAEAGYTTLLGFNEPDLASQGDLSVARALELWPAMTANPDIRVGSPATSGSGQQWFTDFMAEATARNLRVDFLNLHWYGWGPGSCDPAAATFDSYLRWAESLPGGRPIWITEWGCLNDSAPDPATVEKFYAGAVAMLANHPRVERQAFYPHIGNHELATPDGALTALGQAFAGTSATR